MKSARAATVVLFGAACFLAGRYAFRKTQAPSPAVSDSRRILYFHDPMHPAYRSDKPGIAPDCGMPLEPVYADDQPGSSNPDISGGIVVTPEQQQLIGVKTGVVEASAATHTLRTLGRVVPDEARLYRVSAGVDGWIRRVEPPATGSLVRKDQPLATFYSRDMQTPQQGYLYALDSLDRVNQQQSKDAKQLALVRDQLQQAKDYLRGYGMSEVQLDRIARTRQPEVDVLLAAPAGGFILSRDAAPGQRFTRYMELYRIADLSRVWVLADLYEGEADAIHPKMLARLSLPHTGKTFTGRVSETLPEFDPASRTYKLRIEVENPDFALRPEMLLDVEFEIALPPALTVPAEAVLDSGLRRTVFVDRGEGHFEPRSVEIGWRHDGRVQIVKGLRAGERIVTSGHFLLDSESRMQAAQSGTRARDPSCGMEIEIASAVTFRDYKGSRYWFCSDACRRRFDADPDGALGQKVKLSETAHGRPIENTLQP